MTAGRPTDYTYALGKEICDALASCGSSIGNLCEKNPHWPVRSTVFKWRNEIKEFSDLYYKAKKDQIEALVDECIEISDETSNDYTTNSKGEEICNAEWIARSRLRVDTRKWMAARLMPKLYGDDVAARQLAEEVEELKKLLEAKNAKEKTG